MTRRGGETTKRLCIMFMAAAIFCIAMFPGKGFAAGSPITVTVFDGQLVNTVVGVSKPVSPMTVTSIYFSATNVDMRLFLYDRFGAEIRVIVLDAGKTSTTPVNLTNVASVKVNTYYNNQGTGSATVRFTGTSDVDVTPPNPPAGLVVVPDIEKLTLSWSANTDSDLKGYYVYLNGTKLTASSITNTNYVFSNLDPKITYTLSVSAVDTSGNESSRTSITAKPDSKPEPPDTTPPSVPVLQGKPGKGQAVLTWSKSPESDVAGYNLYQDGVKVGNYISTGATVSGLKNGTQYKFQVTAIDAAGNESAKSNQVTVTPADKLDVNLIPNGDSIVVQIIGGGVGPYVINWGSAQKTIDQSQYIIPNLKFDTEYTVTITDANGLTYSAVVNTGTEKGYIPPTFPNPQEMFQKMLDVFGTAGTIALAIIGGAIALGIMCVLALWAWRLLKNWLAKTR